MSSIIAQLDELRRDEDMDKEKTMTKTSTKDTVCGMSVEMTADRAKSEYKGETYYFCCTGCKAKFDQTPEQYVSHSGGAAKSDMGGSCCG